MVYDLFKVVKGSMSPTDQIHASKRVVSMCLSPTILERVDETADRLGLSRSSLVESLLRTSLQEG